MKLEIKYTGSKQGFNSVCKIDIDIEEDAEALGYITAVLHQTTLRLTELCTRANPKYHDRISLGVSTSNKEQIDEQNIYYPFTGIILKDE